MRHLPLVALLAAAACGDDAASSTDGSGGGGLAPSSVFASVAAAATEGVGAAAPAGTGSGGGGASSGAGGEDLPCTDCTPQGPMTFALPSPAGATVWTTTTMDKVVREAAPPTEEGAGLAVFAARNEVEPVQVVVRADADATVTLALSDPTGPGGTIAGARIDRVGYVRIETPSDASSIPSGWIPDPLERTSFGASEPLVGGENQPFWITFTIPPGATAGDYAATLSVTVDGDTAEVQLTLHVFDFALPDSIGFDGNWNASMSDLGGGESLEKVEELKDFFFAHRMVPGSVAWPAGLNYTGGIEYDCEAGAFVHGDGPYDFAQLGPKYIDGDGWNGVGFPSFQVMQFVDNSTPRPQTFCGVDRGPDHFGTDEYNAEWSRLLAAIEGELIASGWEDKGYVYVQNEPQGPADYDVAAFLAALSKEAAPSLRIAVSEEPKPEIAEHASMGSAHYDLWWADLSHFDPAYARTRQEAGDEVWWYFLYGDRPPHFNPITIDHPGIESRIGHWAAWKYRVRGFAYYSVTGWGSDPYADPRPQGTDQNGDGFLLYPPVGGQLVSSIRWELLREGVEDFEYLRLAAGGNVPQAPGSAVGCDGSVDGAVTSTTSFTRDASALQHLRNELGAYLGGERDGCPTLDSELPGAHPRDTYLINFQDPAGEPTADPLMVDGETWIKVGWSAYDAAEGFGWAGPFIGDDGIMLYQYVADAPVSELQRSIIFDDYGRTDTFTWDIENGRYLVTVGIGWYDRTYSAQRVVVEGQVLFDDAETTPATPHLVESLEVDVQDGNIALEAGQQDEYTMLNFLRIEPID